jgi:hypothetical protein
MSNTVTSISVKRLITDIMLNILTFLTGLVADVYSDGLQGSWPLLS